MSIRQRYGRQHETTRARRLQRHDSHRGNATNDNDDNHDYNQQAINDRITWQGKVFGPTRRKCLDYVIMDSRSSARATTGMMFKPPIPATTT